MTSELQDIAWERDFSLAAGCKELQGVKGVSTYQGVQPGALAKLGKLQGVVLR